MEINHLINLVKVGCVVYIGDMLGHTCGWRPGVVASGVRRMNEVNARRARLVRGWVAVFGRVYHLGIYNRPRSVQHWPSDDYKLPR